jgi:hypothetical protein
MPRERRGGCEICGTFVWPMPASRFIDISITETILLFVALSQASEYTVKHNRMDARCVLWCNCSFLKYWRLHAAWTDSIVGWGVYSFANGQSARCESSQGGDVHLDTPAPLGADAHKRIKPPGTRTQKSHETWNWSKRCPPRKLLRPLFCL